MPRIFRRLSKDCSGVTAIEYAVLISLITAVIIVPLSTVGTSLSETFGLVGQKISGTQPAQQNRWGGDHDGH